MKNFNSNLQQYISLQFEFSTIFRHMNLSFDEWKHRYDNCSKRGSSAFNFTLVNPRRPRDKPIFCSDKHFRGLFLLISMSHSAAEMYSDGALLVMHPAVRHFSGLQPNTSNLSHLSIRRHERRTHIFDAALFTSSVS